MEGEGVRAGGRANRHGTLIPAVCSGNALQNIYVLHPNPCGGFNKLSALGTFSKMFKISAPSLDHALALQAQRSWAPSSQLTKMEMIKALALLSGG